MCKHKWQQIFEESLLGGSFPTGWQCKDCGTYISQDRIGPNGLDGVDSGEKVLHGPHGVRSRTSGGKTYSKQILHRDGRLEIVP